MKLVCIFLILLMFTIIFSLYSIKYFKVQYFQSIYFLLTLIMLIFQYVILKINFSKIDCNLNNLLLFNSPYYFRKEIVK